ncbi:class III signal peptide-containing protein [Thermococcus sp. GR6]|uniref:class III signal peptide-containing protein n=1 Tax=Thermococcus sp. GR6 TaxID=1638256 RepID=UPI0014313BEA|nr:class III signal peptide-containing protein [Thermococcus sp. GR6]NJE42130.1 class III signal peptide-containing protein [Thermococcus sp. GR6]
MGVNRGQGSLEYLFMIVAALVIILVVVRAISGISTPYSTALTVDPESLTSQVEDQVSFKVEAWVEDNGDGTYKVYYRIWALEKPLTGAEVQLVCFGPTNNVAGLDPIKHEGILEPVNYWANYWTPVPREAFPCQVQFTLWKRGLG